MQNFGPETQPLDKDSGKYPVMDTSVVPFRPMYFAAIGLLISTDYAVVSVARLTALAE